MEELDRVYWLKADKLLRKSSGVRTCDDPTKIQHVYNIYRHKVQKWLWRILTNYNLPVFEVISYFICTSDFRKANTADYKDYYSGHILD